MFGIGRQERYPQLLGRQVWHERRHRSAKDSNTGGVCYGGGRCGHLFLGHSAHYKPTLGQDVAMLLRPTIVVDLLGQELLCEIYDVRNSILDKNSHHFEFLSSAK